MNRFEGQCLVQLVYTSKASSKLCAAELMRIVHCSRLRNEKLCLTSALFYKDGFFGQILEGDYRAVNGACERIKRDSRHHLFIQLTSRPIQERLIPNYALKFYGEDGLSKKHPRLAEALVGDRGCREDLLRLILLASINL